MVKISLCMIVKNEESVIGRCLSSVYDLVDEIIIVDTGSSDHTCRIAEEFTDNIYHFEWTDDFSAARNFAFSKGKMDFLMWLDADDVIDGENRKKFAALKEEMPENTDVVMMKYDAAFDEGGKSVFSYYRERIFRRSCGFKWEGAVHECIAPAGNIVWNDTSISHLKKDSVSGDRNLRIYEGILNSGRELNERELFYYGRELMYNGRNEEAVKVLREFLEKENGWYINRIQACKDIYNCLRILGREKEAYEALLMGLYYGVPDSEECCLIGDSFFRRKDWAAASYWYEKAVNSEEDMCNGGFVRQDYRDYIPYLQLCLCSFYMGNESLAESYNDLAGKAKPYGKEYLYNKDFFEGVFE